MVVCKREYKTLSSTNERKKQTVQENLVADILFIA